ncbi:hypothetical protein BJ508DRAFT_301875 [Ascobolus immersus RN42]|uniref:Myb-like domain-containing protein n=1 Tax=Ascobolus immersus RN42 TaxID=1160509 RepID=A0A3N4IK42_ASCIM|nr:hypothetical protein BJ508DRAFT_301875 [Ascobolus immersus RN42]
MSEESLTTQPITPERLSSEDFVAHTNEAHAFSWLPGSYLLLGGDQLLRGDHDENATMIPLAGMHQGLQLDSSYLALSQCYPSSYTGVQFPSAPNTPESMEYPESTISPRTLQRYTDQHMHEGYQSGSDTYSAAGGYETDSRGSTPGHGGLYEYRSYHDPNLSTTEIKHETEDEYSHLLQRKADSIEPSLQDYHFMQAQNVRIEDLEGSPQYYQQELQYDAQAQNQREEENALLKHYRESNMSYKQIRAKFGNKYTESTLRGRWRTISKPRGQRVRKPKWYGNDVRLLDEAVKGTQQPHDLSTVKWKEMAEQIFARGGSYKFGVTTCKKKYLEVMNRGLEAVVKDCGSEYPPHNHLNMQ